MNIALLILACSLLDHASGFAQCLNHSTCGDCMTSPDCLWCSDLDYETSRCFSALSASPCQNVVEVSNQMEVLSDLPISSSTLIKPQSVVLNLRPGKPYDLEFVVQHTDEYPLDLYFLFDLSFSMIDSRNTLAEQAGNIIGNITKVTKDFQIGFGSFVDKDLAPFTSTNKEFNCPQNMLDQGTCKPPYSFFHKISLKQMTKEEFKENVLSAPMAGNVDNPEGSLDAMMQVMACKERIGWRDFSRKIIFVATDRDFHHAMDGKLVGILNPSDGKCHLSVEEGGEAGYFSESKNQDYPSISQISHHAELGSFLILFAISPQHRDIYEALSNEIKGSKVATLEPDASNIVHIINDTYKDFTQSVEVQSMNLPSDVQLQFKSDCGNGEMRVTNKCENITDGSTLRFYATITAGQAFLDKVGFSIYTTGIGQKLNVGVRTDMPCPCEKSSSLDYPDQHCNNQGSLTCGACSCFSGYSGQNCECDEKDLISAGSDDYEAKCKDQESDNPGLVCSGRGSCKCGICNCYPTPNANGRFYGKYCQCDDFSCTRNILDETCYGHGKCSCGKCQCDQDWSGEDCSCHMVTDKCIGPYSKKECSNHGNCACNKCICDTDTKGQLYTGEFCEKEPNEALPCAILAPHVEYMEFPETNQRPADDKPIFELIEVNSTDPIVDKKPFCKVQRSNSKSCFFIFTPSVEGTGLGLRIYFHIIGGLKEICEISLGIPMIIVIILLSVLMAAGLVSIIIYKLCIHISDQREYARFISERDAFKAAVHENPLHIAPITKYNNPMYETHDSFESESLLHQRKPYSTD